MSSLRAALPSSILLALAGLCGSPTHAQTYMPDANLRAWVDSYFPGAIMGNYIDETNPGVANATDLQIVNAGVVSLMGMSAFSSLQVLVVEGNPINPNTLELPGSLMSLGMIDCGLTGELDLCFAQNTQLQTLTVSNNQLTSIAWCGERPSTGLNASHNALTGWVGEPPVNMQYFNLAHNQLATPPEGLYAVYVDISHNQLTELPWTYWGVSQTLIASHNLLTSFTGSACTFSNGFVDVSHNQIEFIDLQAQTCGAMSSFDLSHNPLTGGITNLPFALETLTITDTQLDCLPLLPLTLETLLCTNNSFTCLPNVPGDLDLTPANFGFTPTGCTYPMDCAVPPANLMLRACLQGAWVPEDGLMRDALRQQGLMPLTEPYSAAGYTYLNNNTPLSIPASMLNTTGAQAIVDWVIVEFRIGPNMPGPLHQSVPALMRRDGSVISTTGDPLIYLQVPKGPYQVAVKHRNHLGVITFAAQQFGAGTTGVDIMSTPGTQVNPAAISINQQGVRMLPVGDVIPDKVVRYTGTDNDRDPILQAIGGTVPTQTLNTVYRAEDLNLDGVVKYTGLNNDRDLILQVVGGTTPTNTRGQVPIY